MGRKKHAGFVAGATVVALLGGGVAFAAIPDSGGVIHSCYNAASNPAGQLRVIDTEKGATCAKHEKALNFNQTGPTGPTGHTEHIG